LQSFGPGKLKWTLEFGDTTVSTIIADDFKIIISQDTTYERLLGRTYFLNSKDVQMFHFLHIYIKMYHSLKDSVVYSIVIF